MKRIFSLRFLAAAVLLAASVSACNTGSNSGDINVERSAEKSNDPATQQTATLAADSATSGLRPDTAALPTGRQQYESATERKDRNNDGIAD
jgi:predicted small secreted protein